jgi:hypothetical protein
MRKRVRDDLLDDQLLVEQILEQVGALMMLSAEPGNGEYKKKYLSALRADITNLVLCIPSYPVPDWSKLPDWANWWAVDRNGMVRLFGEEPEFQNGGWAWVSGAWGASDPVELPVGCDWRLTLQQRGIAID